MLATLLVGAAWAATYRVVYTASEGGIVTGPAEIDDDESIDVTVIADAGYSVASVTATSGQIEESEGEYTLSSVTDNCVVTAVFDERSVTSIVVSSPPDTTEYDVGDYLDLDGMEVKAIYDNGDQAIIESGYTVTPANGTRLNTPGRVDITVKYTKNPNIEATTYVTVYDVPTSYTFTASATGGTITPTSGTVTAGGSRTFRLTPSSSAYTLTALTDTYDGVSHNVLREVWGNEYTISNVYENHTIRATFTRTTTAYSVTANILTNGSYSTYGGSVTCSPTSVNSGGTSYITVMPNYGYYISSVSDGTRTVSVSNRNGFSFTTSAITSNRVITVNFTSNTGSNDISTAVYTNNSLSRTGGSVYVSRTTVSQGGTYYYEVTANSGYTLDYVRVYNNGSYSTYYDTYRTITAYGNQEVIAYFVSSTGTYSITTRTYTDGSQSSTGGTLTVSRSKVDYGGTYSYTATAKSGYSLDYVRVTDGGSSSDYTSTSRTLTAHGNQTVYAYFVSDARNVKSFTVSTLPRTTVYNVGDTLNTTGMVLSVRYNDNTTGTVSSGFTCSPTKLNNQGLQTITVTYGGRTATFEVTVMSSISGITVKTLPTKTSYTVGDKLDTAGLTLTATLTAGGTQTVSSGFTCTPTTLNNVGTQTITVSYNNRTTTFNVTVSAKNATTYTDVTSDKWYYSYIMDLSNKGIVTGNYNESTKTYYFRPEGDITRAEFVAILARASGESMTSYTTSSFNDVSTSYWAAKEIEWAFRNGVVTGTAAGVFSPTAKITRQDMSVMIDRLAVHQRKLLTATVAAVNFTDAASIASYAKSPVTELQKAGIISGIANPNGTFKFNPLGTAMRCEACKMISVYLTK